VIRLRRERLGTIFLGAVVAAACLAACSPFASKGTLPPPGPNGQVDPSSAPDFLAVAGRDGGIAGYSRKDDVLGAGDRSCRIGHRLGLSHPTVKRHLAKARSRVGATTAPFVWILASRLPEPGGMAQSDD
jgi:hypothetical protein